MHGNRTTRSVRRIGVAAMLVAVLLGAGGCEECCDASYSHYPPPGLGTLLVDNDTDNDISVYLEGVYAEPYARDDQTTPYDLVPGLYRVVLEERGGCRYFQGDIEVLPDLVTVIYVGGYHTCEYYIDVFFL